MSLRHRTLFAVAAALLSSPALLSAQGCNPVDAANNSCFIDPTPAQSTVTAAGVGFVSGGFPVQVAARYLGGIALFQSDVYFFQGFFGTGFDLLNPLSNTADYTLVGGKPYNSSPVHAPGASPWIALPGTYLSTEELVFGIRVQEAGVADRWYYSGYGAYGYDRNPNCRNSQPGGPACSTAYANLFLGGAAPDSDSDPNNNNLRYGTPAPWTAAWNTGNGYYDGTDALLGFEDEGGWSDGDFNDALIALDFSQVRPSVVPEPSSIALVAAGLALTVGAARRRKRKA